MATDVIKLVRNDNRPNINLTLKDENTDVALDLSDVNTTIVVYFRAKGTTTVLSTLTCTKPTGGADGIVQFNFPGTALDVPAGAYEGEIEIDWNGEKQTIYNLLNFRVREEVG